VSLKALNATHTQASPLQGKLRNRIDIGAQTLGHLPAGALPLTLQGYVSRA